MIKKESYGLTSPLITLASGVKMGKTEKGAIWLNEDQLSAYDYWQFWRNTDDRDVKRFLKYFTEIEIKEINEIYDKESNINKLKVLLANEATKNSSWESASKSCTTTKETFEKGGMGSDLPEIKLQRKQIEKGIKILDFLAENKVLASKVKQEEQ